MNSVLASMRANPTFYWICIGVSTPLTTFVNYTLAQNILIKGQSLAIVLALVVTGFAFLLWLILRREHMSQGWFRTFVVLNLVAWSVIALQVKIDGDQFAHTVFLAPLVYFMVLLKPPDLKAAFAGADAFAWMLVAISIATHIMHVSGILTFPTWAPLRVPFIGELFGIDSRWAGPFASTSDSSPVGAFLLMYAWLRIGTKRIIFAGVGLTIILLSTSWTSIFAVVSGFLAALWIGLNGRWRPTIIQKIGISSAVVVVGLFYLITQDPTFNGRTNLWIDYIQAWLKFPIFGMGTNGILSHPEWFTHQHAHNYYIDILTRHGIIGFTITIATLAVAGVVVFKSSREIRPWIGAVYVTFLASLVGETLIDWRSLGYVLMELLLITTIAGASGVHKVDDRGLAEPEHARA
ncbi:O-antigen ligase family protein [Actinomycetota bacterium]|nr:O-antigen ligase family protein [Actinomycetota bacterium]